MRIYPTLGVAAVAGLSTLPSALAWGAAGHEIVATIAQIYLHPEVLPLVCSVLSSDDSVVRTQGGDPPCYISSVASWADTIRWRARWSAPLHYVGALGDHPSDTCLFPGERGWAGHEGGNVLDGIYNVSTILADFVQSSASSGVAMNQAPALAQEALKFLIHFVGDMHQPLHLTGRDRGGNGVKVSWDGRVTNLHSLWDGLLIAKSLRTLPRNYTRPLPVPTVEASLRGAIYDPFVRRVIWEGLGVGTGKARWETEAESWLDCPAAHDVSTPAEGLLQKVLSWVPRKPIPRRGPPQTSDSDVLCPYAWAAPLHALNCDLVWPAAIDDPEYGARDAGRVDDVGCAGAAGSPARGKYLELDTPEYAGRIQREWVLERLLAMGGVRLAGILNGIFLPLVDELRNA
ncbi:phospholipase C/P1 nuclease domain-containing protein [Gloeopeniophorella convolvens]|nr:phospholipase C/P1 nuclease domain-containing protein [Gloeopeniophorella convolvens]